MKNKLSIKWLIKLLFITIVMYSNRTLAQSILKRLPDGTVIYSDGTVRLPNGTIRYPKSRTTNLPGVGTRQPDGSIIYPDGRVRYPNRSVRYPNSTAKYPNRRYNNNRTGWIPPGQAKKMYGAKSARDFAPGHNKGNYGNGHGKKNH